EYLYWGDTLAKVIPSSAPFRSYESGNVSSRVTDSLHRLLSISYPLGRSIRAQYYDFNDVVVHGLPVQMKHTWRSYARSNDGETVDEFIPDARSGRVKALHVLESGSVPTYWFLYDLPNRATTVYDREDCKTEYCWGEDLRLEKIAHYDPKQQLLYRERFV